MIDNILRGYGRLIADHPMQMLILCLIVSSIAANYASGIGMESMDTRSILPADIEVVEAMNYVEDEFGAGSGSGMIVVELNPQSAGVRKTHDVREPEVVDYVRILAAKTRELEDVRSSSSIADYLIDEGRLIQSKKGIDDRLDDVLQASQYVNSDYSISLVKFSLMPDADKERLYYDVLRIVEETPKPAEIDAKPSGDYAVSTSISEQIGSDMGKTAIYSMIGISVIIFFVIFRSFKHGLTSLMAIAFGILWSYGVIGLLGMNISSASAGAASMIMGIGVDFGIQVVSRFRSEILKADCANAIMNTISSVTMPMTTTTLAALIGFRAMTLGRLTLLADLGIIMSLGVLCCMLAAITIIPTLLVLQEGYLNKKKR